MSAAQFEQRPYNGQEQPSSYYGQEQPYYGPTQGMLNLLYTRQAKHFPLLHDRYELND